MIDGIDFGEILDDAFNGDKVEFRDPFLPPYGNPVLTTETQLKVHEFIHRTYEDYPEIIEWENSKPENQVRKQIAMIGAKGAAKTYCGAMYAGTMVQKYPGSVGCLISNSYQQANDNGSPHMISVIESLGYEIEFFTHKKINGRKFGNVYEIRMGNGISSYVLIRSYDAVANIEGVELDWVWSEEGQQAEREDFVIVYTRNRGKGGPNIFFYAAMPEDETHWQYDHLEMVGFVPEAEYTGPVKRTIVDPKTGEETVAWFDGIMYEIGVFENIKNVGAGYISGNLESMDAATADRYVYGKRGSSKTNKVFYSYQDHLHRSGRMSQICSEYDAYGDVHFLFDFNVYPMTCSVWQIKPWNDEWWKSSIHESTGQLMMEIRQSNNDILVKPIDSLEDYAAPDRFVWAQVDELEAFSGGTQAMMDLLIAKYADTHEGRAWFIGDATGNRKQTSATTTDWNIIAKSAKRFKEPIVKRGLISNNDIKTGKTKYSNPLNRDAVNEANRILRDAKGRVHTCFLPKSSLKSGGCAASVSNLKRKPNGEWDISEERKEDPGAKRSHFADTFKYGAYFFKSTEQFLLGQERTRTRHDSEIRDWDKEERRRRNYQAGFIN